MNTMLKTGLLTLGLGIAFCPVDAGAAVTGHTMYSNAVNNCQAFTPGPSNTIRNRVIGSENIGTPIAVACNFSSFLNGAAGGTVPTGIVLYLSNGTAAVASVTCTLLTGAATGISAGSAYAVTKTISVPAGAAAAVQWTAADNPAAGATDLGNLLVGVNCTLPTNITLSTTATVWSMDNGV